MLLLKHQQCVSIYLGKWKKLYLLKTTFSTFMAGIPQKMEIVSFAKIELRERVVKAFGMT